MSPEASPAPAAPEPSDRGRKAFARAFQLLRQYREDHGHCLVPSRPKQFARLSAWASRMRRLKSLGRLPKEHEAHLDALGFEWNHDEGCWQRMRKQLAEFAAANGHCLPAPTGANTRLAHWVYAQRALRQSNQLAASRIASLDQIGFQWSALDARWWKMHRELAAHATRAGSCDFEWDDNSPLARWCRVQRRERRHGRLAPDRIEALDRIGFSWSFRTGDDKWGQRFEELKGYARAHGHCSVPINYRPNQQLGLWVFHQRQFHKRGELSQERIHKLESIGFSWSVRDDAWKRNFGLFKAYVATHGHDRIDGEHRHLAAWAYDQRLAHRKGTLSPERKRLLDEVNFRWAVRGPTG